MCTECFTCFMCTECFTTIQLKLLGLQRAGVPAEIFLVEVFLENFRQQKFSGCGQRFLSGKKTLRSYQLKHSRKMLCRASCSVWAVTAENFNRRKFPESPCNHAGRGYHVRFLPIPYGVAHSLTKRSLFGVF